MVNLLDLNTIASTFGTPDPRPATDLISTPQLFLDGGVKYSVVIEYSNKSGPASMRLYWNNSTIQGQSSSPSTIPNGVEVPASRLYPASSRKWFRHGGLRHSAGEVCLSNSSIDSKDAFGVGVGMTRSVTADQLMMDCKS